MLQFGIGLEARESQQKARRILAIMCTKNEIKINHTKAQKRGDWIDSKSPEGTRRMGPPFPIKSNTNSHKSMVKSYSKERNGGRETQGRRPGREINSRTSYKSHTNLIQVKGYLYPWRLVRPVPWTGQTGARDRSDRLVCNIPLYTIPSDG